MIQLAKSRCVSHHLSRRTLAPQAVPQAAAQTFELFAAGKPAPQRRGGEANRIDSSYSTFCACSRIFSSSLLIRITCLDN